VEASSLSQRESRSSTPGKVLKTSLQGVKNAEMQENLNPNGEALQNLKGKCMKLCVLSVGKPPEYRSSRILANLFIAASVSLSVKNKNGFYDREYLIPVFIFSTIIYKQTIVIHNVINIIHKLIYTVFFVCGKIVKHFVDK